MNAQVSFLEGELSLIHIPLELYATFVQPILHVLLPQAHSLSLDAEDDSAPDQGLTADNKHSFLNISITPVECSIVCRTYWAEKVFKPLVCDKLPKDAGKAVSISKNSYIALCVMSGGMDAGSRVVDLSSPLALAGIPIFFVTTYYSDFILVPTKDRHSVVQALLSREFVFSEMESSFVSHGTLSHQGGGGGGNSNRRGSSVGSSISSSISRLGSSILSTVPTTPPPSNAAELQDRTFIQLRNQNVVPYIVPDLHVAHCSGHSTLDTGRGGGYYSSSQRPSASSGSGSGSGGGGNPRSWADTIDARLYTCLVSAMVLPPKFLSVTLTELDPPSMLLDKTLLPIFGSSVVGDVGGDLVPIFLDLVNLPFEATGIVSGVAGKLVSELRMAEVPELSYLSTSKAGAVILESEHAQKALQILQPLLDPQET
ncbi:hypothetical protein CMQ_1479 [Grosmannia clavigera kw1407]|uniref:CASTOR ACT domain-containing protein n=1 Tax=Grosmannia clavigera (strain kw1407 / UAMH 11150) TaxID=655863 RepID=F0XEP1_GROCL|nr:uncharacterized protein CMQ_1479 [Grosmannia clavigera kw1407]EFX04551.1 hypothetical protein CMQ_1479 [Grosmannia clavigera kw1407]